MEDKQAEVLRKAWGDKPCEHPKLVKETYLGADTLDKVCTQCGQSFSQGEAQEILRRRP